MVLQVKAHMTENRSRRYRILETHIKKEYSFNIQMPTTMARETASLAVLDKPSIQANKPQKKAQPIAPSQSNSKKKSANTPILSPQISHLRPDATKITSQKKFRQMIERTVETLSVSATPQGDITFHARVKADIFQDLEVEVALEGVYLNIHFFTHQDPSLRRLLQGYEREIKNEIESLGLKIKTISVTSNRDEHAPALVPVYQAT